MWPDLAKFRHFGKSLLVFGKFLTVYFLFDKMLSILWQICDMIGLIFIDVNGQILKNNLTIWSHWLGVSPFLAKPVLQRCHFSSIYFKSTLNAGKCCTSHFAPRSCVFDWVPNDLWRFEDVRRSREIAYLGQFNTLQTTTSTSMLTLLKNSCINDSNYALLSFFRDSGICSRATTTTSVTRFGKIVPLCLNL